MKYDELYRVLETRHIFGGNEGRSLPTGSTRQMQLRYEGWTLEKALRLLRENGKDYDATLTELGNDLKGYREQLDALIPAAFQVKAILGAQVAELEKIIADIENASDGMTGDSYLPL